MSRSGASAPGRLFGVRDVALLDAAEMRAWDERAIRTLGIGERVLMERAGVAAARIVERLHPTGRVAAAVGPGNNGGDAAVLLRALRAWGREVVAVTVADAPLARELLHGWEIETAPAERAEQVYAGAAVVVDGVLGTGARGAPRAPHAALIEAMSRAGAPVVALDGPSGVDLSDGTVAGTAVRAEVTVTFGAPKRGLLLHPGRAHAGRILAVEVGFPPLESASAAVVTPAWAAERLPRVPPNAHKGTLGTVTVLAGSTGVAGAAVLVAMGALRGGAGKVRVVSPTGNREIVQTTVPEALFTARDAGVPPELFAERGALVAGPGMGTDAAARAVLIEALVGGAGPVVLDADALTLLAREPALREQAGARPLLLTPHPGEMARLLETETAAITADPFGSAARAAERFDCAVLLKGAPSLVAERGQPTLVNLTGHAGVATGGMGDTLAGVAGALLAAAAAPREAGALALYYAGRAAELAGRGRALLPRDVDAHLGEALLEGPPPRPLALPEIVLDVPAPY